MGFNGSGTFVRLRSWIDDRNNGIKITADRHDEEDDGFAAGLSNTITKDGQSTTTARIPFAAGVSISDGNVGSPGFNFISDTNSGVWRIGADNIGIGVGGSKILDIASAGLTVTGAIAATTGQINGVDIVTLTATQTLTNKTLTAPIIATISNTGTLTLPTSTDTLVGRATTDTLTNKTINLTSNTLSGTTAQFNSALSDGDFATLAGSETLTNKTLTSPTINSGTFSSGALSGTFSGTPTFSGSTITLSGGALALPFGHVMNWSGGNYTITHSAGALTTSGKVAVNGASATYSFNVRTGTDNNLFIIDGLDFSGTGVGLGSINNAINATRPLHFYASAYNFVSDGAVSIANGTGSTSTTTGALKVAGGIGVVGQAYIGGVVSIGGPPATFHPFSVKAATNANISIINATGLGLSTSPSLYCFNDANDALVPLALGASAFTLTPGDVSVLSTTASTSTTTGALKVAGGVGIAGNTYIGGNLDVAGTVSFGGATIVSTTGTQTLTNKTLTSPVINGASLSGTFSGDHTLSGNLTMSATVSITSAGASALAVGNSTPVFVVNGTTGGGFGTMTVKRGNGTSQSNHAIVLKSDDDVYLDVGASGQSVYLGQTSTSSVVVYPKITPSANNAVSCGSSSNRWTTVFSVNADDISSDERDKVFQPHHLGLDFVREVSACSFVRKDDPRGRLHFGVSAQQLQGALRRMGIPDGSIVSGDADEKLGVAYDELIAPLIAAAQELDSRLSRVESHLVL